MDQIHGKPITINMPMLKSETAEIYGCMADTVTIHRDIILPIEVEWEANE